MNWFVRNLFASLFGSNYPFNIFIIIITANTPVSISSFFVNPYKVPNSFTSSEYGGRLEEEFEEMDDMDEEMDGWIDKDEETGDNLFSVPVDVEEEV